MSTMPQQTEVRVLSTINLGQHHLILMSDQSLDLISHGHSPHIAEMVLRLDRCEAYRLLLLLHELFKERSEETP